MKKTAIEDFLEANWMYLCSRESDDGKLEVEFTPYGKDDPRDLKMVNGVHIIAEDTDNDKNFFIVDDNNPQVKIEVVVYDQCWNLMKRHGMLPYQRQQ